MSNAELRDDRLVDLLVKQTTEGVTLEEQAEIERLLATYPGADREIIARTAAAIALAGVEEEPLPTELRDKLRDSAARWVVSRESKVADLTGRREARAAGTAQTPTRRPVPATRWPWFAAAACLVLAITGWWPRLRDGQNDEQQARVEPAPVQPAPVAPELAPPGEPTPAESRERLLASQGTVNVPWTNTADPASQGVTGDVVWDNTTQTGYMRFSGLAANDPQRTQYQLWIFDKEQDERFPIDGGVFDVPAGATEVVVPIKAAIAVREPLMFAVTIEKAGGVVVSNREHIVTLAKATAG
jgi:Anti-sigma-K factor rskA